MNLNGNLFHFDCEISIFLKLVSHINTVSGFILSFVFQNAETMHP